MDQVVAPKEKKPGKQLIETGKPKRGGRKQGSQNKTPRLLKEALMIAAELEGSNEKGKDKLIGFLRMMARKDLRTFAQLLGRIIPLQINTKGDLRVEVTYRTIDDVRAALADRGISLQQLVPMRVIEHDDEDDDE